MAGGLPIDRSLVPARAAATFLVLLLLALAWASGASAADEGAAADGAGAAGANATDPPSHPPGIGPPGPTPGIPSPEELEAAGAVIGQVLLDNQNIFNPDEPKDDNKLFRAANDLHIKTRPEVIRKQLLFKPGERYNRRLIDESERILRAE